MRPKKTEEQRLNSLLRNYLKEPDERPTDERITDLTVLALVTEIVTNLLHLAHAIQSGKSLRSHELRVEALAVIRSVRQGTREIERLVAGMRNSSR